MIEGKVRPSIPFGGARQTSRKKKRLLIGCLSEIRPGSPPEGKGGRPSGPSLCSGHRTARRPKPNVTVGRAWSRNGPPGRPWVLQNDLARHYGATHGTILHSRWL